MFRAPPSLGRQLSKRASEPDAEPRPRGVDALLATGSCPADPTLTRRLRRRCVAVCRLCGLLLVAHPIGYL